MKTSDTKITGVLHHSTSAEHYLLRRYQPSSLLATLVEQFWLVNWDLRGLPSHTQQNLPDPNMHLVITTDVDAEESAQTQTNAKIIGPVSKKFNYCMQGQGAIIGVKFNLGVLAKRLPEPVNNLAHSSINSAVDREFEVNEIFTHSLNTLLSPILKGLDDQVTIHHLSHYLQAYIPHNNHQLNLVQALVEHIKSNNQINKVEQLAALSGTSVRTIQRLFKDYVGLSPKWLIRKYRLHHAIDMLENNSLSLAKLAADLDYADQSHLIRDFNEFLNITPKQYALAAKQKIILNNLNSA